MKTIELTDDELDFIKKFYRTELEAVEKYVVQVREMISKLEKASKQSSGKSAYTGKKRGRKPGTKKAFSEIVPKKPGPKAKNLPTQPTITEPDNGGVEAKKTVIESTAKGSVVKKSMKRKHRKSRKGRIYLAPLSKPLKIKEPVIESIEPVNVPEPGEKPESTIA